MHVFVYHFIFIFARQKFSDTAHYVYMCLVIYFRIYMYCIYVPIYIIVIKIIKSYIAYIFLSVYQFAKKSVLNSYMESSGTLVYR